MLDIIKALPQSRKDSMFKNSEDEKVFDRVLLMYIEEFGVENLVVFLPRHVSTTTKSAFIVDPMEVKYWKKNLYSIRVKTTTAGYDFPPAS